MMEAVLYLVGAIFCGGIGYIVIASAGAMPIPSKATVNVGLGLIVVAVILAIVAIVGMFQAVLL